MDQKKAEFEQKFSSHIGVKHSIGVSSCTAALDLSIKAYGIESAEVLIPAITSILTAHAVVHNVRLKN